MKRLISALLTFFVLCTLVVPFNVSAAAPSGTYGTDYIKYGDVDINQSVNIIDALYTLKQSVNSSTLTAQKKGPADVDQNTSINSTDALLVLQYAVEVTSAFTEEYIIDKIGGGSSLNTCDGIPDKYQKKVTFAVSNGKWSNNSTANIVQYKTLVSSGKYSTSGSSSLSAPTGMIRNYGYTGGAWNTTVPSSVSGNSAVTYTYSFSRMSVNYTIQHFRPATVNASYSSTPNETETKSGYVGDTVTATSKSYAGYSYDSSKSTASVQLKEETANNVMKMYYGIASSNYITNYSKTNVNNGSYTTDSTADTSYSVNINSLKPYTIYNITADATKNGSSTDFDYMRLICCLQGLINRDFGKDNKHTTLVYYSAQGNIDSNWLSYISASDSIMKTSSSSGLGDGLTKVNLTSWSAFYSEFKEVIKSCGIILWDQNVPATSNVASTICGLDGYLPVRSGSSLHTSLSNDGVTTKQTLVGLFSNGKKGQTISGTSVASTGSAKNDAYLWAIEKYYNRTSANYIAYILDGSAVISGNPVAAKCTNDMLKCLFNFDYIIARRCFCFDLDPIKIEGAFDDPAQVNGQASTGTDYYTMIKLYEKVYARLNGGFTQLLGFPPHWCKYCSDNGSGTKDSGYLEWLFSEIISCYNIAMEADASGTACMTNGSAYYKFVPKKSQYTNNNNALESITYDPNTYYYTIYAGDYDCSAWLKVYLRNFFEDSAHGTFPVAWGIAPNLSYRVPMVFDYMYENKAANDCFVGGTGAGAGYVVPDGLFHDRALYYMNEKRPAANADAGTAYANMAKTLYQRFDMKSTGFIINSGRYSFTANISSMIAQYSPKINITNMPGSPICRYGSTYFVFANSLPVLGTTASQMYDCLTSQYYAGMRFSALRMVLYTPTYMKQCIENLNSYAASKGVKAKYVDINTYYNLLHASGHGSTVQRLEARFIDFENLYNHVASPHYDTVLSTDTSIKSEGSAGMRLTFTNPTGRKDSNKVGGMSYHLFDTPGSLIGFEEFSLDFYLPNDINGNATLQVNFVTNGQDDGFNFDIDISNMKAGWHTATRFLDFFNAAANAPNYGSISAMRFTYFNYSDLATPDYIVLDNLMVRKY